MSCMVLHSYSPENVPTTFMVFQKEQSCWCVGAAGARPPNNMAGEITLECYPPDWVDEADPIRIQVAPSAVPIQIITDNKTKLWIEFQELVIEWKKERGSRSSISQAAVLQPYQKIIGMGESALPLIIAQLKSEGNKPDQWFWALRVITKQNPVKPEDRGNFPKMAQAWLEWAESQDVW